MANIVFISNHLADAQEAALYLKRNYGFQRKPLRAGIRKLIKPIYYYGEYRKISREIFTRMYDALYEIDNNIWISYLSTRLKTAQHDVIVEDPRYVSELQALQELGFITVRIKTNRVPKISAILLDSASPGTILLSELYNKSASKYKVDYTIYRENKEAFKKSLDELVDSIRANNV